MKKLAIAIAAAGTIALAGCANPQTAAVGTGAVAGAAIGGLATNSVAGAIIGAGVGALAGAVLVETHGGGWCTYRYNGQLYRERCR
jgi:hypothetical protein